MVVHLSNFPIKGAVQILYVYVTVSDNMIPFEGFVVLQDWTTSTQPIRKYTMRYKV